MLTRTLHDGPRYVSFPTEFPPERRYGSGYAGAGGGEMPQYRYNGHTISISAMSAGDAVKVDTEIFLRPDAVLGVTGRLRASTLRLVPAAHRMTS
jgi:hypothetical protein